MIIIAVFAGFASGELVSLQQMRFGVAIALLIDATIVRLVVMPAALQLLGERDWYLPSWLEWLPHVEVEIRSCPRRASPAGPTQTGESEPMSATVTSRRQLGRSCHMVP